jgi:hypothetical protein
MSVSLQRAGVAERTFAIRVSKDGLDYRPVAVRGPFASGRDILQSAGFDSGGEVALFAVLPSGDFEDVRLDEQFDLGNVGAERFIAFATDRTFRLTVSGSQVEWGRPAISGAVVARLAGAGASDAVFLHVADGDDVLVETTDLIDLTKPGVERFYLAAAPTHLAIVVNGRARTVEGDEITFEQIVQLAFPNDTTPNAVFSMTFRHAAPQPHSGDLAAGGRVRVKKGTVFNVTRTVQS